jgi:S-adenosylmethionine:diacylglycerol 3-amino-3-carboxypropyl transferase
MYEDPAIELEAFAPSSRVFCIASAGCTARALSAAGHIVTAVDINPLQILYAKARAVGAPFCEGAAERLLSRARTLLPLFGWTETCRRKFLSMRDPFEQHQYWGRSLDTRWWRMAVDTFLSASLLKLIYTRPFVASLPRRFGSVVRARLERTWRNHPNASNPYAWRLLLGEIQPSESAAPGIRFECADAACFLEACKPAGFDAFSLSNIADGASPSYVQRLYRAVKRAAVPGAFVVTRTFAQPATAICDNLAAHDRSMLWGAVQATRAEDLCSTF